VYSEGPEYQWLRNPVSRVYGCSSVSRDLLLGFVPSLPENNSISNCLIKTKPPATRFIASSRAFTTSRRRFAELDHDEATPTTPHTSIPPVTPKLIEHGTTANDASTVTTTGAAVAAAEGLSQSKQTGGVIGTYTAYGATKELYKECARQADYKVPQAQDSDAEMPKTEDGEDLGVGEGWWHTGIPVPNRDFVAIQLT
jgi:hypothetical protein